MTFGAGIFFGLTPALGALGNLAGSLSAGGRRSSGGRSVLRTRNALLVSEVALALVLTVGAGLLVRTFNKLLSVDGGFNPERVLTFELSLSGTKYGDDKDRIARFYHEALERLKALPGVEAAGLGEIAPLGGAGERRFANFTIISPDYPKAVGMRVLRGGAFPRIRY